MIVDYIPRPSDLLSLCKTNRRLHTEVLHELYDTVTLDIDRLRGTSCSFTGPRNDGLQHVRNLRLHSQPPEQYNRDLYEVLSNLVGALVCMRDLKRIYADLDANVVETLWPVFRKGSSALETALVFNRSAEWPWPDIAASHQDRIEHYHIATFVSSRMRSYQHKELFAVTLARHLRTLEISIDPVVRSGADAWCEETHLVFKALRGTHNASNTEALPKTLSGRWLKLRVLNIHHADFLPFTLTENGVINDYDPAQTLCTAIRVDVLTALILQDYECCELLLKQLMQNPTKLRLQTLVILSREELDEAPPEFQGVVDRVLKSFTGLVTLVVSANVIGLPDVTAIAHHSSTLKTLYIDNTGGNTVYKTESLGYLCSRCEKLEQVALPLPDLAGAKLSFAKNQHFTKLNQYKSFEASLVHLMRLPRLTTLRILNFEDRETTTPRTLGRDSIAENRTALATRIFAAFEQAHHENLYVVAWGRHEKPSSGSEENTKLHCFLRRVHVGPRDSNFREIDEVEVDSRSWWRNVETVPLEKRLIKYEEPASDILDVEHDLYSFLRFGYRSFEPRIKAKGSDGIHYQRNLRG